MVKQSEFFKSPDAYGTGYVSAAAGGNGKGLPEPQSPPVLTGGQKSGKRVVGVSGGVSEALRNAEIRLAVDFCDITFNGKWVGMGNVLDGDEVAGWVWAGCSMALGVQPDEWFDLPKGGNGYTKAKEGPEGARLCWGADGRSDVYLHLPGKACGVIGGERMAAFLRWCKTQGGRPSRLDVALDDFSWVVRPSDVLAALQGPEAVSHAEKGRRMQEFQLGLPGFGGETVYLGHKSSRQQLRVYDKFKESDGEIDACRWELQMRDEAAWMLLDQLVESDDWGEVFRARLVAFVDFREVRLAETEDRARVGWFARLLGLVKRIRAYPPEPLRTLGQVLAYGRDHLSPTLAIYRAVGGDDLLREFALVGKKKLRPKHFRLIAEAG